MIAILKHGASDKQIENLCTWFGNRGLSVHLSKGESHTILGLIGDTTRIDTDLLMGLDIIESVKRVSEPYKSANRKFHPEDTIVDVGGVKIGGGNFQFIAGPCSVETHEQICEVAGRVKTAGAGMLRGGAFKPRTSPYSFQGLQGEGIRLLEEAKAKTGLPIVTEVMDIHQLEYFDNVDVIQVGARNMQNFELLKELGKMSNIDEVIALIRASANTQEAN